ncbi:preprotein translocase subunit SecE [Mesoplasma lactucae]|uniref:Preprotein translocase subunit SecE n=1 Tax=Mesoplasma lactucae ATCC 49193 TaxID=81460 RepID=A0A291ISI1_9MOLU|nr:preprotein translocase subunit SecE [Mesoplasma lactucae]ATG97666.1 preprotein translocase subunit SecE [Mesoplasma lactucae ATCC 49193]ATZ19869.1 preprotein translocase subunit SecE [Mesoplasma lactucae ATCC 49193]MCL8216732.1 hypothetical protein [Mesoplasma lactucae ATCC 49193]
MTEQEKELKKEQKRLKKEAKAKAKVEKSRIKAKKRAGNGEAADGDEPSTKRVVKEKEMKKNLYNRKNFKRKAEKEKTDWKLGFKEFPVKMVKEVNKIQWSGKRNLTNKFIQVIIFMLVFAVVFYLIDWGFQALFTAIHVI